MIEEIKPGCGIPMTSYGPKDHPTLDNGTWFSTMPKDHPLVMDDREFRIQTRIDTLANMVFDLQKQLKALQGECTST